MSERPAAILPRTRADFARFRIWDSYGMLPRVAAGANTSAMEAAMELALQETDRFAIERFCPLLQVATSPGGGKAGADDTPELRRCLQRWPDRILGIATVHVTDRAQALADLDRWLKDGPMVGIYLPSSAQNVVCTHPNYDVVMPRAHALGAAIFQHTWYKTGGKDSSGESTPAELAELARRHPEITFICVHAGGEWEKGLRAVRDCGNVLVETSGFDPTAGFIEMTVRELGAKRVVYGGHYPGRSFGTELSKVFGAQISDADRQLILGENFRRLLRPILTRLGRKLE